MTNYTLRWFERIGAIPQKDWDNIALPLQTPFLEWEWLHTLETSGSVNPREGWHPYHLTVWEGSTLLGAAPLYLKGHSYGEFVFDHQWADISHRIGIPYYPKLLGMTPFTPAVGYRFLVAEGEDEYRITEIMVKAIDQFCQTNQISGCHFLFVDPQWQPIIEQFNFRSWLHHSYVWSNNNYNSFEDYLQTFNANQRRNIKRERKAVEKAGLIIKSLQGDEIPHHFFPLIYRFYSSTCDKFWGGSKYLNHRFFEQLYSSYRHRVVLFCAFTEDNDQQPVGLSFCLHKEANLYGRYWGCFEEFDCLHFEACYYQPIEWAIANNVTLFDPGAGGRHKRRRGFPATPNFSVHRFYPDKLEKIFNTYISQVNDMEQREIDGINQELPFVVDRTH